MSAAVAGMPYSAMARLFRPASIPLPRPRRVLILKPCCLGDVMMATALASALRRGLPSTFLAFAVGPWSTPALTNNPHLNLVLTLPWDMPSMGDLPRLASMLRRHGFDWCFVPDRSPILGLAAWLAGIPVRMGLDSGGRAFACNLRVATERRHEMDLYLDLARAVGIPTEGAMPTFVPDQRADLWALEFLDREGLEPGGFTLLHPGGGENPGSRLPSKRWPAVNYAQLADRLADMGQMPVVVGAEEDAPVVRDVLSAAASRPSSLAGRVGLVQLAALAKRACLYVGNDTGATHLAAAVGAPTVAIFGPTDPERYGPRGPRVRTLGGTRWDGDLRREAPPAPAFPTLEEVWEACRELLHAGPSPQPAPPAP